MTVVPINLGPEAYDGTKYTLVLKEEIKNHGILNSVGLLAWLYIDTAVCIYINLKFKKVRIFPHPMHFAALND
jgi:hypothetical protein